MKQNYFKYQYYNKVTFIKVLAQKTNQHTCLLT